MMADGGAPVVLLRCCCAAAALLLSLSLSLPLPLPLHCNGNKVRRHAACSVNAGALWSPVRCCTCVRTRQQ